MPLFSLSFIFPLTGSVALGKVIDRLDASMPHPKKAARLGFDADNCERMFRAVDNGPSLLHRG